MKIVFIVSGLSIGGAEGVLFNIIKRLRQNETSIHVISLTKLGEVGSKIRAMEIPISVLNINTKLLPILGILKLIYLLKIIKPDIVQTWMYHADLIGGTTAKFFSNSPIFWGVRSADFLNAETKWSTKLCLRLCVLLSSVVPNTVIFNSQKGASFHSDLGYNNKKTVVIRNGIDLKKFKPLVRAREGIRSELNIPQRSPIVGMVGRFDPLKNHSGFINAAAMVVKEVPNAHFVMAGSKVDSSNFVLLELIKKNKLENNVHLLGTRKDMPFIMSSLDVCCLSSSSEGCPNVLIEAIASGTPCISTDVGDVRFIINDHKWIVPIGDMAQLKEKIVLYLSLPEKIREQMSRNARKHALRNFDVEAMVNNYVNIYLGASSQIAQEKKS